MIDLTTRYLGLDLVNPFMSGASPLDDLGMVMRLEDAGASAIVMHSLFEEEIDQYELTVDQYLEQLLRIKQRVRIPVIGSLNGTTAAGWLRYARALQQGGADAIELNFYHVPTDPSESAPAVERRIIDIVAVLTESIDVPLAVKLSPFFSALPHLAAQLERMGTAGLVLFNRFYEADIDVERREPKRTLRYSDSSELALRLRWVAILSGQVKCSLAVTGGVHTALDAVKAVLAGADTVQIVSAVMIHGPSALRHIRDNFVQWAEQHGFASVRELRGAAAFAQCATPADYERANYVDFVRAANQLPVGGE